MGIQSHWVNENGQIHRRRDGRVEAKNPNSRKTGSSRNAHFMDMGDSPWTHSFEEAFNEVDSLGAIAVRNVVRKVSSSTLFRDSRLVLTAWKPSGLHKTITNFECLSTKDLRNLARLAISITVRSPAFQYKMSRVHPAFSSGQDFDPELGKANVWQNWADIYRNTEYPTGPLSCLILISKPRTEFVMGDGLFETVTQGNQYRRSKNGDWDRFIYGGILLPISPEICAFVLYDSNIGQKLAVLSEVETNEINEITALCSRRELYFRSRDFPGFNPQNGQEVRSVSLTETSFLKSFLGPTLRFR